MILIEPHSCSLTGIDGLEHSCHGQFGSEERLEAFTHFTGTSGVVADVIRQSAFLVKSQNSGEKTLRPGNLDVVDSHDGISDTLIPSHGVSLSQQNLHTGLNLQDFFVEERDGIVNTGDIVLQYHLPVAP